MADRFRWAILGTGAVANRFAKALHNIPDRADLLAVGSRAQATAEAFGERYGIPRRYGSYQQAADDPDVDIVYIATPHQVHRRDAGLCLEAGKHVLCEKAFTMNAQEACELIELARARGLFLMEAMWTRFFPIHTRIRELLAQGALGTLQGIVVHHNYMGPADPTIYDPREGVGAFMDQAPYVVGIAYSVLGPPQEVTGLATFGETGLCTQACHVLKHAGGALSTLVSSRVTVDLKEAFIFGTQGKIEIHDPWYKPTAMTVTIAGRPPERIECPLGAFIGYEYEALAVMDCIAAGQTECAVMPLDESLAILQTMDAIRAQWRLADG
jgi:predicted dehydrogenase